MSFELKTRFELSFKICIGNKNRLRESLTKEICLIRQALEWGDQGTSDEHFEAIIQVRGELLDLRHNLQVLIGKLLFHT